MPMPVITIKLKKDGKPVASWKEDAGRVRTSPRAITNWTRVEMVRSVLDYGLTLQLAQVAAGLGSDGQPMPGLKDGGLVKFAGDKGSRRFEKVGYPRWKVEHGLQPRRDLRGPGKDGHMLDAIRVNYVDDVRGSFAITTDKARIKAQANERRAQWWGWAPASVRLLAEFAGQVFPQGVAERLVSFGLMAANQLVNAGRVLRRAA